MERLAPPRRSTVEEPGQEWYRCRDSSLGRPLKIRLSRRSRLLLGLTVLAAAEVRAQCPDGTPPPCGRAAVSSAARPAPTRLSARTWIVVPFTNATRTPDLDWVRDAAVNLLALDLGRWTDIRVVDDKAVGDLARELPAGRASLPLTLNDGMSMARRAGAGRLVMGDYFRLGAGARFIVNVFDVSTGARLRSVTAQATSPDSVLSAFGPIAHGVLALPAPPDAKLGAVGTTRVDAYQEYLLGTTALNRFAVDTAIVHLKRAIALDSTFALAHHKLGTATHWSEALDSASKAETERAQALTASRLAGGLPPRERTLINARLAIATRDYERACQEARGLLARDSTDVEALYTLGECEYHGGRIVRPIDSAHAVPRGNWNVAIASFRRVLALDPTYYPAFEHIVDMLHVPFQVDCGRIIARCPLNDPAAWYSTIVRDGDSLIVTPMHFTPEYFADVQRATRTRTPARNQEAARRIAMDWVEASQHSARALVNLGQLDIQLGDLGAADSALAQIGADADLAVRSDAVEWRLTVAEELADGTGGRRLLDSLRGMLRTVQDSQVYASHAVAFGKLGPIALETHRAARSGNWSPQRLAYLLHAPRILLGIPDERVAADERAYWESIPGDSVCSAGVPTCRTSALLASLAYGLTIPRTWLPSFAVASSGVRFGAADALWHHDPKLMAATLKELDSLAHDRLAALSDEGSSALIAVDAALAYGDSATALRMARFATDTVLRVQYNSGVGVGFGSGYVYFKPPMAPRAMLRRAQLEAALGSRETAKVWYDRVLSLWAEPDPELQPAVAAIRAARERLR